MCVLLKQRWSSWAAVTESSRREEDFLCWLCFLRYWLTLEQINRMILVMYCSLTMFFLLLFYFLCTCAATAALVQHTFTAVCSLFFFFLNMYYRTQMSGRWLQPCVDFLTISQKIQTGFPQVSLYLLTIVIYLETVTFLNLHD